VKDSDLDPVFGEDGTLILWGYPMNKDGTVAGDQCLYCSKVYDAQYKVKHGSMKAFKKNWEEEKEEFNIFRKICVDKVKEAGTTAIRMKGGGIDKSFYEEKQSLNVKRKRETMLAGPEDKIWEEDEYDAEFGDYKMNGRGHNKVTMEGVTGILVPGRKIHTIQRRRGQEASIDIVVKDGANELTEDQMQRDLETIDQQMRAPAAVGEVVDDLRRRGRSSVTPRKSTAAGDREENGSSTMNASPPATSPASSSKFGMQSHIHTHEATTPNRSGEGGRTDSATRGRGRGNSRRAAAKNAPRSRSRTPKRAVPKEKAKEKAKGGGRGRPEMDTRMVSELQVSRFGSAPEDDDVFYGDGHQKHKAFLIRVKNSLETKMQAPSTDER
jgi:hypothetical protein